MKDLKTRGIIFQLCSKPTIKTSDRSKKYIGSTI